MVDTVRTDAEILARWADNTTGDIDPQDIRDGWVTLRAGKTWINTAWSASALVAALPGASVELASGTYDLSSLSRPIATFAGIARIQGHGRNFTILDGGYDALALNASGVGWFNLANGGDIEFNDVQFTRMGRIFDFDGLLNSGSAPRFAALRLTRVRAVNVGALIWGNDGTDDEITPDLGTLILDDVQVTDSKRGIFVGNVDHIGVRDVRMRSVTLVRPKRFGVALGSTLKNPQRHTRRINIDGLTVQDWVLESGTNCAALFLDAYDVNVSNLHIIGTTADGSGTWAQSDKECIYTKAVNINFNNITVRASAGDQSMVALKGGPDDDNPVSTPNGAVAYGASLTNFKLTWDATRPIMVVDPTDDTLVLEYIPWPDGTEVKFHATTGAPTGLTDGATYFIRDRTAFTVKLATTLGGAAVDITSTGTGRFFLERVNAGTSITGGIWIQSPRATIAHGHIEGLPNSSALVQIFTSGSTTGPNDQLVLDDIIARYCDFGNAGYRVRAWGKGFFFSRLRFEKGWMDGGGAPFIEIRSDGGNITHVRINDCHSQDVEVGTHSWVILHANGASHVISDVVIDGGSMQGAGHDFGVEFDGAGTIQTVTIQNVDFRGLADATKAVSKGLLTTDGGTLTDLWIRNCPGIVTENRGTATLVSGSTSVTVNHGLTQLDGFTATPAADELNIHPVKTLGSASFWWVDTITTTQFTIRVNANPGADVDFAWRVRKEKWA